MFLDNALEVCREGEVTLLGSAGELGLRVRFDTSGDRLSAIGHVSSQTELTDIGGAELVVRRPIFINSCQSRLQLRYINDRISYYATNYDSVFASGYQLQRRDHRLSTNSYRRAIYLVKSLYRTSILVFDIPERGSSPHEKSINIGVFVAEKFSRDSDESTRSVRSGRPLARGNTQTPSGRHYQQN